MESETLPARYCAVMSQENVEIVVAALQDFNQRRRVDPDLLHDDGRLTGPDGWPERGPWQGKRDVLRQFDRLFEDFSKFEMEDIQVIGHDEDWAAVAYRWHTRGIGSGIEDVTDMTVAFRIRDGRVAEVHFRWTREQALDAAGLSH